MLKIDGSRMYWMYAAIVLATISNFAKASYCGELLGLNRPSTQFLRTYEGELARTSISETYLGKKIPVVQVVASGAPSERLFFDAKSIFDETPSIVFGMNESFHAFLWSSGFRYERSMDGDVGRSSHGFASGLLFRILGTPETVRELNDFLQTLSDHHYDCTQNCFDVARRRLKEGGGIEICSPRSAFGPSSILDRIVLEGFRNSRGQKLPVEIVRLNTFSLEKYRENLRKAEYQTLGGVLLFPFLPILAYEELSTAIVEGLRRAQRRRAETARP